MKPLSLLMPLITVATITGEATYSKPANASGPYCIEITEKNAANIASCLKSAEQIQIGMETAATETNTDVNIDPQTTGLDQCKRESTPLSPKPQKKYVSSEIRFDLDRGDDGVHFIELDFNENAGDVSCSAMAFNNGGKGGYWHVTEPSPTAKDLTAWAHDQAVLLAERRKPANPDQGK